MNCHQYKCLLITRFDTSILRFRDYQVSEVLPNESAVDYSVTTLQSTLTSPPQDSLLEPSNSKLFSSVLSHKGING